MNQNREVETRTVTVRASVRPPNLRPATQTAGMVATLMTPDSDLAPRFEDPKTFIQKWSNT